MLSDSTTTAPVNATSHPAPSIRWMIRRDLAEVLEIERRCFKQPWDETEFVERLKQRDCIGMVAERGEKVVGYMLYELPQTRIRITNFAVEPDLWRQGIGRVMAEKLTGKLSPARRTAVRLEIRESNLPAQLFFHSLGFRAVNVLRNYFDDEDAYAFSYKL
jgi:ribosomal-protein-alanine N-acetyltransferase